MQAAAPTIQDPLQAEQAIDPQIVGALTEVLKRKRDEAISGRKASGIEQEWIEDEEAYQGIDDANRGQVRPWWTAIKGWVTGAADETTKKQKRSRVFVNITAPYCDAAAARVADMLMPTDDRCFKIKPTPIASAIEAMGGTPDDQGVQAAQKDAEARAEAEERAIDDYLVECHWHGEVRAMIEDSSRLGTGILKGPFPRRKSASVYQDGQLVKTVETRPASKRIDPWSLYPDPACGENIHDGAYVWEEDAFSGKQIRDLIGSPGYITSELLEAIKEGPQRSQVVSRRASEGGHMSGAEKFQIWYFYGTVKRREIASISGYIGMEAEGDDEELVSVHATLVNDRLVRIKLNVLDTGEYPYDVLAWKRRPGMPWGIGVARQIRTPQRILNSATRAVMDNAGWSAAPQTVIGNGVTPMDGVYAINVAKLWRAEADVADVRAVFATHITPNIQAQLMPIVQFALKMAEEVTGLPAMLQGLQGNAPDTVGGMEMLQNNSSGFMRRIAKRFDDFITEPHITRYHNWLMQYDDRQGIKGDHQIDARGSTALVERSTQGQFLVSMMAYAKDPAYGIDPAKMFGEILKSQRMAPETIQYDEQTRQAIASKANPLDEAKALLLQAQAEFAKAQAVTKGIEGMFSAVQSAVLLATNPRAATPADNLLRSAGFQDQDAAPIVPQVAGGAPGLPMPQNTHPAFPANPDVGMRAGIEGGGLPS